MTPPPAQRSGLAAYLLWFFCLTGICGLHRFYLGRPWSGLLWLVTFGLLGIGQIVDLFLMPSMLREENRERRLDALYVMQQRQMRA
ncbi:TM2 domain-containing protein [Aureimonas endophytica]|nr:TM2 domain-containing protein [Aureimonas endophytica]